MTRVMLTFSLEAEITFSLQEYRGKNVKITFQGPEAPEIENRNITRQGKEKPAVRRYSYGAAYGRGNDRNWIAGNRTTQDRSKTLTELQLEAENTDVGIQQDYRTVMANTLSAEDYAKMEKEGFDFSAMDPEEAVTIVDKIKAELARSGQYIAGYTDDLDQDTLAAALGSETLANAVTESFREANLPLTEENIAKVKKAWDMAKQLSTPSEASYQYMVDHAMEPEVWNFYLAQSSVSKDFGAEQGSRVGQPRFYAEEIRGYYTESAKRDSVIDMQQEIDRLLVREGLDANEENRIAAQTLLDGALPITKENIALIQKLESVAFPVTEGSFARAAAVAVAEGKTPAYANLSETKNLYEKAVELLAYFRGDAGLLADPEDITARRQLEEIRLRMSAEVNVKLIRSGFAIDTAPMEELVEALRRAEAEVAQQYFPQEEAAVTKYELYRNTNEVVAELPSLPAQLLGLWSTEDYVGTLAEFHAEGKGLQESYAKAQSGYEALMTTPRRDLGDSIQKAFANVDDILQDMGMDATEENRRAVRILGYNRMTIDAENIQRVQAADQQVCKVIEKMTPASVLKMIRDDKNPLEMSFEQLEQYLDALPESYEENAKSYSRFLYGLEQNKQITAQEREAFIGIYRMLHQIDASDGAAVGALVNTGAGLHFSNLLSAVRSSKFKSMDVSVTESFGATVEVLRKGESITDQIAKGFVRDTEKILTQMSNSEETEEYYRRMELQQVRQAANVRAEGAEMLTTAHLPLNADNLLAAQALTDASENPFLEWKLKKMQRQNAKTWENVPEEEKESADSALESLTDFLTGREEFQTHYRELLEAVDSEVQEMSFWQGNSSLDVRGLQLIHKQLSVAEAVAREEEYIFPMYIGEELTKVHLTLEHGEEEKGSVSVMIDLSKEEHLEAHFQAGDGKISGFLVGNAETAVMRLVRIADIFTDSVQSSMEGDWEVETLPVVNRQDSVIPHRSYASVNKEVPGGERAHMEVDNTELYRIAKVFLEAVQK